MTVYSPKNNKDTSEALTAASSDYLLEGCDDKNGDCHNVLPLGKDDDDAVAQQSVLWKALWVLRLAILADAINSQILGPNYALMVMEDGHTVRTRNQPKVSVALQYSIVWC